MSPEMRTRGASRGVGRVLSIGVGHVLSIGVGRVLSIGVRCVLSIGVRRVPSRRELRAVLTGAAVVLSFAAAVPASATEPCDDARAGRGTPDSGWQVQVDPDTGVYSMPAPRAADDVEGRAAATTGVVITPGRSAAGGFKATFGDDALVHEKAE